MPPKLLRKLMSILKYMLTRLTTYLSPIENACNKNEGKLKTCSVYRLETTTILKSNNVFVKGDEE